MEENRKVKIHVSHLKKSFGSLEVLKDINTDIYEGEVVVVLGPSGSGKSTFLRCINRLEDITSGDVMVDGINVSDNAVTKFEDDSKYIKYNFFKFRSYKEHYKKYLG